MPSRHTTAATTFRFPTPEIRDLIDTAAKIVGTTRTAFILTAAKKEAEKTVRDAEQTENWRLSAEASLQVADALAHPRSVSPRMKKLARHYREFTRGGE
jgi:uncharacterized protein (DUF1778 family)